MANALRVAQCYKEALEQESVGQRIKEIVEKVRRRKRDKQRHENESPTVTVLVVPLIKGQMRRCLPGEASEPMLYPRMECNDILACNQEQVDALGKLAISGLPGEEDLESIIINNRPQY